MIYNQSHILFRVYFNVLHVLTLSSSYSPLKIILKQLFVEGEVNIAEYLPRRSLVISENIQQYLLHLIMQYLFVQ